MKAILQRVSRASVHVDGDEVSSIKSGLLVFLGVVKGDTESDLQYLVKKVAALRIFEDAGGKMNLSVIDVRGGVLVVSQFTLAARTRKGTRPSFTDAEAPEAANAMYERYMDELHKLGIAVSGGRFGAMMDVSLVNDGPVTIILDSRG